MDLKHIHIVGPVWAFFYIEDPKLREPMLISTATAEINARVMTYDRILHVANQYRVPHEKVHRPLYNPITSIPATK